MKSLQRRVIKEVNSMRSEEIALRQEARQLLAEAGLKCANLHRVCAIMNVGAVLGMKRRVNAHEHCRCNSVYAN